MAQRISTSKRAHSLPFDDLADPRYAKRVQSFFKTGKGEYAEGDIFIGIRTPALRTLAKKHTSFSLKEITPLLKSKIHEKRLFALILLVEKYKMAHRCCRKADKRAIYLFYRAHFRWVNNWDLVDISCPPIVGEYLSDKDKGDLMNWATSPHLWTRRIAIVSNWWWIRRGELDTIFKVAKIVLKDEHDLIHKATGWMLRETDKRDRGRVLAFLDECAHRMPRVMLRYTIERYPHNLRQKYLRRSKKKLHPPLRRKNN